MTLDYRPDSSQSDYRILSTCLGYFPYNGGYRTAYGAAASGYNTALTAACIGARAVKNDAGTVRAFYGSAAAIEEANGAGGWTDRSKGGGYTSGSNRWWFTQGIAANEVIATNYANAMQVSTGAAFSDLTNAPKAKIVVTQSEALLAMYYDDGTVYANGIKISDRGASTTWTAAASNDAATVRLVESPGAIVAGATINDLVIAWKRRSMYVGRFVGGDEKWQFNLLSPYVGCLGIEAWCATPAGIIFIGEAGVFLFDGSVPRNIDQGIRKLLRRQLNSGNSYGANTAISHDDVNSTVYIWMPDAEGAGDDLVFAYNYVDDRWSVAYSGGVLGAGASYTGFESIIRDYTLLDHVALAGTDDASAQIGHFIVTDEHKVVNLNNSDDTTTTAMNTSMVTGRVLGQGAPDGRFTLKRVIPVFDSAIPSALSLSVAGYQYPGFSTSSESTTSASLNSMARFDLMANANNFALTISGTNKNYAIRDLALQVEPAGKK